uniref:Uncharacterized protein n=1 Tax=Tanacetum cinerariifolium TaxID=118510 RepID=A0A6L2M347_TANCI|nr:hypothetical protein [Tanacetum cinerariifolium]
MIQDDNGDCRTVEGGEYGLLDFFEVYETLNLKGTEWCSDLLSNEHAWLSGENDSAWLAVVTRRFSISGDLHLSTMKRGMCWKITTNGVVSNPLFLEDAFVPPRILKSRTSYFETIQAPSRQAKAYQGSKIQLVSIHGIIFDGWRCFHGNAVTDSVPAAATRRDTIQLETAVSTISQEYLLEFTSEYGISEDLHPELSGPKERIVDFPEGKVNMDLFNLIRALNLTKVKTGTRPRAAHEVPLLIVTASRVIEMEDPATATYSSGVPSTIERSPLDFTNENPFQQLTRGNETKDQGLVEEIAAMGPRVIKERIKRGNDGVDTNAPPKVLRKDHADSRPTQSTVGGKSLASMGLGTGSTIPVPTSQETPLDVSDPDPLSLANPQYSNISYSSVLNLDLPRERPLLENRNQRIPPLPIWSGHLKAYISRSEQYNINLAWQVAMGSQLRLRFEQEAKLLKKFVAQVARRDQRIQAREKEIKNLEALLEAETDMKKTAEAKNAELGKDLEKPRALFLDLQVSNDRLYQ